MTISRNLDRLPLLFLLSLSLAGTACGFERSSSTSPSARTGTLVGQWASAGGGLPSPQTCNNFDWRITSQTGPNVAGEFSATCAGGVQVSGTATGTVTTTDIQWSASGAATAPGVPSCSFQLTGTAKPEAETISVSYAGTTCLGPVSGVEVLRRR